MPRTKKDPETDSDPVPKGESLPPMEDFVRRMSTRVNAEEIFEHATAKDTTEEEPETDSEESPGEDEEE